MALCHFRGAGLKLMVQVLSDREFSLQQVVKILLESAETSNDSNLVLQLALTALVKQVMRELVQASEADHLQGKLLQSALQRPHNCWRHGQKQLSHATCRPILHGSPARSAGLPKK